MLHELYNKRRLISLYILPFLIGSWLTLICQGCLAMDMDSSDVRGSNVEAVQSSLVFSSHCNNGVENKTRSSNSGLDPTDGNNSAPVQCQQLMLVESLITDDTVSSVAEITDYSSPVLLYSYTDPQIHFSSSGFITASVHARSDLYIPEKNRILLV